MNRRPRKTFVLTALFLCFLVLTTCKNPLVSFIEDTVAFAVTPPGVLDIYPDNDAFDVPINTQSITVTFTKAIDPQSVTADGFIVTVKGSGERVSGTLGVSGDTITFKPNANLRYSTVYVITVKPTILDTDGNPIPDGLSWEFTTGLAPDTTAPIGISITIDNDEQWTTSRTVRLTLEAMDNYGVAQMNIANNTQNFFEANWVPYSTDYAWELEGDDGVRTVYAKFRDGAGLTSAVAVSDEIMLDTTLPVVSYLAINGGAGATRGLEVSLGVSGEDTPSSSGVSEYHYRFEGEDWPDTWEPLIDGTALVTSIDISGSVTQSGDEQVFEARVRDLAGNVSVPVSNAIVYDLNPPTIQLTGPADGDTTVPADGKVVYVVFNEEMDISSFTVDTFYVEGSDGILTGELVFESYGSVPFSKANLTGLTFKKERGYFVYLESGIKDVAGNELGSNTAFWFQTSDANDVTPPSGDLAIDGFIGTLPGNETFTILPDGSIAVNHPGLRLRLTASDDYNQVREMNFWGDGDLPFSYSDAHWEAFAATKDWTLDLTEKKYKLWYRLKDDAFTPNTSDAVQYAVVLDTSPPTITDARITNSNIGPDGYTYVNDPDGLLELLITADDVGGSGFPGSGIQSIALSNSGSFTYPDDWRSWSPLVSNWVLSSVTSGPKTVFIDIQDFLTNSPAVPFEVEFYYDAVPPTISFDFDGSDGFSDVLEVNAASVQTGTFDDNVVGFNGLTVDDLSYAWEQVGGAGEISFSDSLIRSPEVQAADDGTYILKVSVTDPAGNTTFATIPFIWDETPPGAMTSITGPSNDQGNYATTAYPSFTWQSVDGAGEYRVEIVDGGSSVVDSGATAQTGYTAGTALGEGAHIIYVQPFDKAGNSSAAGSYTFFVDTIAPSITNAGQLFLKNAEGSIDYSGTNGSASDGGSGVAEVLWSQTSGPDGGTVTFTPADTLSTIVSADLHGYYGIALTVTDVAGNSASANFTLNWDIVAPGPPNVSGIDRTPNLRPTWSWSSGGSGGAGSYEYSLDGGAWTAPDPLTPTSYTPASPLANGTYTLSVRERDEVGNWSDAGSHAIWVDDTYVAPPEVNVVGGAVRNDTSIQWNWTSGAAQDNAVYRWRINGGSWIPSIAGAVQQVYDFIAPTLAGQDQTWTIEVEEYSGSRGEWLGEVDGKYGYNTVRVDLMGPVAPNVYNISTIKTSDTTPTWGWNSSAGSDGTGIFRYELDGGGWSAQTTQTIYTSGVLGDGDHTLQVQEQDALGNWGGPGSFVITVDTTPPSFGATPIELRSLTGNTSYTGSVSVTAYISATPETGMQMRFYDYNPGWTGWEPYGAAKAIILPSSEGARRVYVQLMDDVGNATTVSVTYSDTIILDLTAPANIGVALNSGDVYTPSLNCRLSVSATDNYAALNELQIRYYYNGVWSDWVSYADPLAANTNFTKAAGNKYVYVQVRDPAGNTSPLYDNYDSIYLQIPQNTYAYKGVYSTGATYVFYNPVTEPTGANTTYYYTYCTENPNADPNVSIPPDFQLLNYTSSTSYNYVSGFTPGKLYYFHTRAYNADSGGFGAYSNGVLGFSSHATIVYDDDEPADVTRADTIKWMLESTAAVPDYVSGTKPVWSATMLPEDLISNTYDSAERIYGDPIIITPGSTFSTATTYDGRVRNIVSSGRGIVAMGLPGGSFLYRVDQMWSTWGLTGTQPSDIDSGNQMGLTATKLGVTRPYNISESIWYTPLAHDYFTANYRTSYISTELFTADVSRRGVYIPSGANPTDGAIYAGDPNYSYHFPVVRQGRFLFYGFYEVPDTLSDYLYKIRPARAGVVFFVNLIARMDDF